jgi:hypothetical protein
MEDINTGLLSDGEGDFSELFGAPNMTGTPERRLLLAILERAILDYVGNEPREVEEAREWIFEPSRSEGGRLQFSFMWLCEQLDLDHRYIALQIKAMPRRGKSKIAPWYMRGKTGAHCGA